MHIIPDVIHRRASEHGADIAYSWAAPDGTWASITWREFQQRVNRLASRLQGLGLSKGDPVGLIAKTSLEWEWTNQAILTCGGVVVGLEPYAPTAQLTQNLRAAGVKALVVEDGSLYERLASSFQDRLDFIVTLQRTDGSADVAHFHNLDSLMTNGPLPPWTSPVLSENDYALIVFTSGTSGEPKGIRFTHGQVLTAAQAIRNAFPNLQAGLPIICWLPLANFFQRMVNLIAAMMGLRTYFSNNPKTIIETVRAVGPAFFIGVPRVYEKIYQDVRERLAQQSAWKRHLTAAAIRIGHWRTGAKEAGKFSWLRFAGLAIADGLVLKKIRRAIMGENIQFCLTGSAPTPIPILTFFHAIGIPLLEAYALSENTVPIALSRPESFRIGSVGQILAPNETRVSTNGEVFVRGPGLFLGYIGESAPVNKDIDGFYATGDFGRFDEAGFLYLTGRRSDLIKTSTGRRIAPIHVEAVYGQSPYIDQIVVLGQGRSYLTALVTIHPSAVAEALRPREKDIPVDSALMDSAPVRELIEKDIQRLSPALAPYEQVRAIAIVGKPSSIENGEITASLKLRRHVIAEHYNDVVSHLYENGE